MSMRKVASAVRLAWNKAAAIDEIYSLVLRKGPWKLKKGWWTNYMPGFIREIDEAMSLNGIRRIKKEYREKIEDSSAGI